METVAFFPSEGFNSHILTHQIVTAGVSKPQTEQKEKGKGKAAVFNSARIFYAHMVYLFGG